MNRLAFYWHIHHDILCEVLTEPLQNRIDYIKSDKPTGEVKTRLRLLKRVRYPEKLPLEWRKAYTKLEEARTKWMKANTKQREADAQWKEVCAKWEKVYVNWEEAHAKWRENHAKWEETYAKYLPQIEALHKEECPDCPWNGATIFP